MKNLKTFLILVILSISVSSCVIVEDCDYSDSGPVPFTFDLLDTHTGVNLFLSEDLYADDIYLLDLDRNKEVSFSIKHLRDGDLLVVDNVGWYTEDIRFAFMEAVHGDDNVLFIFEIGANRLNDECGSYTDFFHFYVDEEYEWNDRTNYVSVWI